jgi:hypothetical protein
MLKEMVAVVAIGMDAVVAEMVEVAAVVADQAAVADQVAEGVLVVEVVVPVEGTEKVVLVGVSAGDLKIRSFKWVEK